MDWVRHAAVLNVDRQVVLDQLLARLAAFHTDLLSPSQHLSVGEMASSCFVVEPAFLS